MASWKELRHFPEFVKISHSVFALPFALGSLLIAERALPSFKILFLVIAAVICARFTAMAFNRIVDSQIDAQNPRTAQRHIPAGIISPSTAWFVVILGAGMFVFISWKINLLAACLSPIALGLILGYSFMKRFSRFSHFVLGIALGLAPLGAWVASKNDLNELTPWLLAVAVMCWVAGFDMIYALQDAEFDRSHGLHSMIVALGEKTILRIVPVLHLIMLGLLIWIGMLSSLSIFYFVGLLSVACSLIWEQWLVRHLTDANLQKAFFQANAIASFGFLAAVILGIFVKP
jgi:4-hydroxybenzoate polyprenyltransferase